MKKTVALLLALVMLVAVFAACGKKDNGGNNNPDNNPSDGNGEIVVRNFGGSDFTALIRENTKYEFVGSLSGDRVEQAVVARKYEVEKDYNVNLVFAPVPGGWDDTQMDKFITAVRAEKMSGGTDNYDLVATHSGYLGWLCVEGDCLDMSKYPEYIHFDKPWWSQNLYEALNIDGHVFMMIGDIAHTLYQYINVMFVNETKFEDYFYDAGGVDMLYDLVDAGEWTWAKLWEYASDFGEGEEGKYGIYTNTHAWRASFVAQDAYLFYRDSNGRYALDNNINRRVNNIVDDMVAHYSKPNLKFALGNWSPAEDIINPLFLAGDVLFYPQMLGEASKLFSDGSDEFGVVPLPKYNAEQEMYMTQCRDTVTAVMMMCTTKDPEKTAILTEALAYYGRKNITHEYYENALEGRYLDRYADILDTIRAGLTYVATDAYLTKDSSKITLRSGSMRWDIFHTIMDGSKQAATMYSANVDAAKKQLEKFYANVDKIIKAGN